MTYATREEYLQAFIEAARPQFDAINAPLPVNLRVSVGFTSKGQKSARIGEAWADSASEDGNYEIFIAPTIDNPARVCDVLTHELIHTAVGFDKGHGPVFKRAATSLGLTGPSRATVAGPEWYKWALPIIEALGPMPYAKLSGGMTTGRKKQKTALLKVECPCCGFLARVTAKHIEPHTHLNCPVPDCDGVLLAHTGEPEGE